MFLLVPSILKADPLVYDNGADLHNSTIDTINVFHKVKDDFKLSSAATLDKVVFGEDTLNLNGAVSVPLTVDWCIGTAAFAGDVACGTGTITPTATGFTSGPLINFSSTFSLPNVVVGAGTYFLTFTNGTSTNGNNDYWTVSATSGDASLLTISTSTTNSLNNEASFQIDGTTGSSPTPEPGSVLLLGAGLLSLPWKLRKRCN